MSAKRKTTTQPDNTNEKYPHRKRLRGANPQPDDLVQVCIATDDRCWKAVKAAKPGNRELQEFITEVLEEALPDPVTAMTMPHEGPLYAIDVGTEKVRCFKTKRMVWSITKQWAATSGTELKVLVSTILYKNVKKGRKPVKG